MCPVAHFAIRVGVHRTERQEGDIVVSGTENAIAGRSGWFSTAAKAGLTLAVAALLATSCSSASDNQSATPTSQGVGATDFTIAPEGAPKSGGSVTYGLEAETDGFNPTINRFAISGHMVAQAVFDTLTALDSSGEPQPYLAESVTPNADSTVWTIKVRSGVTFHDGTPLTSAAVKASLDAYKASGLTGPALAPVSDIAIVDDLTVAVTTSVPWAAFASALTGQVGYIVAPSMTDPATSEATVRAPVGTGPFKFVSWTPNQAWVGEKNTSYWQEGLPYLDQVTFRPIPAVRTRQDALTTGELQMMHTSSPEVIAELRTAAQAGELQLVEDRGESEESFVLLNLDKAPLNDVRVRQALAYATDTETFNEVVNAGVAVVANNVFTPGSKYRVETDYPSFDVAKAKALIDEYKADPSTPGEVTFTLATTPVPENQRAVELLQQQWAQAGINVTIKTVDQAAFIPTAISGEFDANLWRQLGAPDPDVDYIWWWSGEGTPNILNFPNLNDAQIDAALNKGRQSTDPEVRKQAYADLQKRMNELIPYVWLNHTLWAVAADNNVRGILNETLPNGSKAYPIGGVGTFGGLTRLTGVWLAN